MFLPFKLHELMKYIFHLEETIYIKQQNDKIALLWHVLMEKNLLKI